VSMLGGKFDKLPANGPRGPKDGDVHGHNSFLLSSCGE
jgi:hypothetical protein